MMDLAGSSSALFAVVWSAMCLVSAALVTDTMLRDTPASPGGPEEPTDAGEV